MGSISQEITPAQETTTKHVPKSRYHELDSLRGLAALSVVFHHFKYMWFEGSARPWTKFLAPVSSGAEAVILFFLLSGFVLTIPTLRGKGQPYGVYLVRRILRLYGPYLGGLALSLAGVAIWHTPLHQNWWSDLTWYRPIQLWLVVQHILFIGNYPWSEYNTAFWSLVIEMRISLIFPVLLLMVRRLRAGWSLLLALICSMVAQLFLDRLGSQETWMLTLKFISLFLCGIVMATHIDEFQAFFLRQRRVVRWLLLILSVSAYTFGRKMEVPAHALAHLHFPLQLWLVAFGAAGYMILALSSPPIKGLLSTRPALFLGRISYSLYLVHGTVLFALTHLLRGHLSVLAQFPIFVALSLGVGYVFCVTVEEPFLRVSRWAGRRLNAKAAPVIAA